MENDDVYVVGKCCVVFILILTFFTFAVMVLHNVFIIIPIPIIVHDDEWLENDMSFVRSDFDKELHRKAGSENWVL